MILKVKFKELEAGQRFFVTENAVNDRSEEFMKIEARPLRSAPPSRTECGQCGTPLAKWVNATRLVAASNRHFCLQDDVYIVHDKRDTTTASKRSSITKPSTTSSTQAAQHIQHISQINRRAHQLVDQNQMQAAYDSLREATSICNLNLGQLSDQTLITFDNIAAVLRIAEQPERGLPYLEQVFLNCFFKYGSDNQNTHMALEKLVEMIDETAKKMNQPSFYDRYSHYIEQYQQLTSR